MQKFPAEQSEHESWLFAPVPAKYVPMAHGTDVEDCVPSGQKDPAAQVDVRVESAGVLTSKFCFAVNVPGLLGLQPA